MDNIMQFISNVGFPIAMCCALCYYVVSQNTQMRNTIDKNTQAVNELILLIQKLVNNEKQ